jgi:hypothetical protein
VARQSYIAYSVAATSTSLAGKEAVVKMMSSNRVALSESSFETALASNGWENK